MNDEYEWMCFDLKYIFIYIYIYYMYIFINVTMYHAKG